MRVCIYECGKARENACAGIFMEFSGECVYNTRQVFFFVQFEKKGA